METKKVSIIIPVYNAETTIEKCIVSLLNGTYKNIEVIVIDDCSTDDSLSVCYRISERDYRVHVLANKKNSGVSRTRNNGLEKANGDYIMFVDSDDWVEPGFVETHVAAMKKQNVMFAVSGYFNEDICGTGVTETFGFSEEEASRIVAFSDVALDIYKNRLLQQLWNKIFDANVIRDNNICFDESISIGEDFRFILNYVQNSSNRTIVKILDCPYHYMRINKNSLMNTVGREKVDEQLYNLELLYRLIGMDEDEIQIKISKDRETQVKSYAYLIMHNAGMNMRDKKRFILNLDTNIGVELYKESRRVYVIEKILRLIKR